jgi:hypothetical protein
MILPTTATVAGGAGRKLAVWTNFGYRLLHLWNLDISNLQPLLGSRL